LTGLNQQKGGNSHFLSMIEPSNGCFNQSLDHPRRTGVDKLKTAANGDRLPFASSLLIEIFLRQVEIGLK